MTRCFVELPIANIHEPVRPLRSEWDEDAFEALVQSVTRWGVLQPLVVTRIGKGSTGFRVLAGHRRLLAARKAGFHVVPCLCTEPLSELTALTIGLVENVVREGLSPLEEAAAIEAVITLGLLSQQDAAARLGMTEYAVSRSLLLLRTPPAVQQALARKEITKSAAEELAHFAGTPRVGELLELAKRISFNAFRNHVRALKREADQESVVTTPAARVNPVPGPAAARSVAPVAPAAAALSTASPAPAVVATATERAVLDRRVSRAPRIRFEAFDSAGVREAETLVFPDDEALRAGLSALRSFTHTPDPAEEN